MTPQINKITIILIVFHLSNCGILKKKDKDYILADSMVGCDCYCGFKSTISDRLSIKIIEDTVTIYSALEPGNMDKLKRLANYTRQFIFKKDSIIINEYRYPFVFKKKRAYSYSNFLEASKQFKFYSFGGGDYEYEFLGISDSHGYWDKMFQFKIKDSISKVYNYYDTIQIHPILGIYDKKCLKRRKFNFVKGDSIAFRKKIKYFENKIGWDNE